MTISKKTFLAMIVSSAFLSPLIYGAKQKKAKSPPQPLMVVKTYGESSDQLTMLNIRFNQAPPWKKIHLKAHGSFLQFHLPETIITNPGEFIDVASPVVEKMAFFQLTEGQAMARIFLKGDLAKIMDFTDIDILGNRVLVTIDHRIVASKTQAAAAGQKLAGKAREAALPNQPAQAPAALDGADGLGGPSPGDAGADLTPEANENASIVLIDQKLKWIAYGSLLLFSLVLMVLTIRRVRLGQSATDLGQGHGMRAISHLALTPKQRLSLIQVGNEKILVAVSPDQVNLIKTFAKPSQPPQAKLAPSSSDQGPTPDQSRQRLRETPPPRISPPSANRANSEPGSHRSQSLSNHTAASQSSEPPMASHQRPLQGNLPGRPPRKTRDGRKTPPGPSRKKSATTPPGRKINVAVDDDGVKDMKNGDTQKAIEDVTKLIRQKLKHLPKMS